MGAKGKAKAKAKLAIGKAKSKGKANSKARPMSRARQMAKTRTRPSFLDGTPSRQASPWAKLAQILSGTSSRPWWHATPGSTPFMKHYEGLSKHSDKLKFALQLKLDRISSFMTASETHSIASVEKDCLLRMVLWRIPSWPTCFVC